MPYLERRKYDYIAKWYFVDGSTEIHFPEINGVVLQWMNGMQTVHAVEPFEEAFHEKGQGHDVSGTITGYTVEIMHNGTDIHVNLLQVSDLVVAVT